MSTKKVSDVSSFQAVVDRLKEALGVRTNRDVAMALGITASNLGERKARDALPREQIDELCGRIDESPTWVYDGVGASRVIGRSKGITGKIARNDYAPPLNSRLLTSSMVAMESALRDRGLMLDAGMRAKLVAALYEMSLRDGRVNPAAVQPLISLLTK